MTVVMFCNIGYIVQLAYYEKVVKIQSVDTKYVLSRDTMSYILSEIVINL